MRTETLDGINWFSFPSLFQNEDGTWVDMSTSLEEDWMPAYKEALKRGEVIEFGEDKETAFKFGEGSWKKELRNGGSLPKAQRGKSIDDQGYRKWLKDWLDARKKTGRFEDQLNEDDLAKYKNNINSVQQITRDQT